MKELIKKIGKNGIWNPGYCKISGCGPSREKAGECLKKILPSKKDLNKAVKKDIENFEKAFGLECQTIWQQQKNQQTKERRCEMRNNHTKMEMVIEKVKERFPYSKIFGVIMYPEINNHQEEIAVFGGCSERQWLEALVKIDPRDGINHHKLITLRSSDLTNNNSHVISDRYGYWSIIEADNDQEAIRKSSNLSEKANLDYATTSWIGPYEKEIYGYPPITDSEIEQHNCGVAMSHGMDCQCGEHE